MVKLLREEFCPIDETTVKNLVIQAIQDEWKTIVYYNNLIGILQNNGYYSESKVVEDINKEESVHVGQLTSILTSLGFDSEEVYQGMLEGDSQIEDHSLSEDTVKKSNGKWTNRGDDGTEHGEFDTKKEADAQRKAMYANGYKG